MTILEWYDPRNPLTIADEALLRRLPSPGTGCEHPGRPIGGASARAIIDEVARVAEAFGEHRAKLAP